MFTATPEIEFDPIAVPASYPPWFPTPDVFFALPRHPMLRDYFSAPAHPPSFIEALCAPASLDAAWSTTVHLENISINKQTDAIFIPAQCVGSRTLGICVLSVPHFGGVKVGTFVRDDSDGSVFILIQSQHTSDVDVYAIVHHGSMRIQRSHLRFASFADYLTAAQGFVQQNQPIPQVVASAFQSRSCHMCRRADGTPPCSCRLSFISPCHNKDFSPFRANMQALAGNFCGVNYRVTPAEILPAEIAYKSSIAPLENPHMFSTMIEMAIQNILQLHPFATQQHSATVPDTSTDTIATAATAHTNSGIITAPADLPLFAPIAFSDISNSSNPPSPMDEISYPFSLEDILANEGCTPPSEFEKSVCGILAQQHHHMYNYAVPPVSPTIPQIPFKSKSKSASISISISAPAPKPKGDKKKKKRKKSRELSPKELAEREARRELRIAKNRQAAARSNLRRKQQNDSLKAALAAARNQALQLRDRHLKLREENLTLKMALFAPDKVNNASLDDNNKAGRIKVEC